MFRNTLKTAILLGSLGGFLVLCGALLGGATGLVIGLGLGLAVVGGSYWYSDRLAVRAARARPVEPTELVWLQDDLAALAARAGLPTPRLFLTPDPQPNAFATGRNERRAVVCVTQGLLDALPRDEVRGVVAHELAHIRHRDILIGSVAAAIATGISAVANLAYFTGLFGGDDDDRPNPVALLLMSLLAPLAASVLQLALSRSREYEADRLGAELLGDPVPLARALTRIDALARQVPMDVAPARASAYIVNPLTTPPEGRAAQGEDPADGGRGASRRQLLNGGRVGFARLFLTHPPTEARVAKLVGTAAANAGTSTDRAHGLAGR